MNVRVRGIYATALTRLLRGAGHDVVQASPPIRRRFDAAFADADHDVSVASTEERRGVGAVGDPDAVAAATDVLGAVARDALVHEDPAPRGAVFDATVTETLGAGAVVDLGDREGYLPYDAVEDRVEDGDDLRVQVVDERPPWADGRPEVATALLAPGGMATVRSDLDGTTVDGRRGADARELAGLTELVDADVPDGWGVEWTRAAAGAEMDVLRGALARAAERAAPLRDLPEAVEPPRRLAAPVSTAWVRFNRESRFALDDVRGAVAPTMPGHHRVKAGSRDASGAVDFVESVCTDLDGGDGALPFEALVAQFGPAEGDRVAIEHGKPDGRQFTLGRGRVSTLDVADREITVRRELSSSGTYDGLGTERERGDVAITRLREGRWWYPTAYRGTDGTAKGTYVNVCTPIELFPGRASYVDLHVDVVKTPDGTVEVVDGDELDEAVAAGHLDAALSEKAMDVARTLEDAL